MLQGFDHVNVRTANLEAMVAWYGEVLGLTSGRRPPFPFPGAWMYLGDAALVHLVGVEAAPEPGDDLRLEHAAFRATGLGEFLAKLDRLGQRYELARVPGFPIIQANVWDPDGNHLHVDFPSAEADALGLG
jgi:catechol 2,3-dioxygenase-like lactoylglutathione lyase family enzyme